MPQLAHCFRALGKVIATHAGVCYARTDSLRSCSTWQHPQTKGEILISHHSVSQGARWRSGLPPSQPDGNGGKKWFGVPSKPPGVCPQRKRGAQKTAGFPLTPKGGGPENRHGHFRSEVEGETAGCAQSASMFKRKLPLQKE